MSTVFSSKKAIVIGVVVFILSLMQIDTFADQGWELRTQLSTERITFATAVVGDKIYLIGGTLYADVKPGKAVRVPMEFQLLRCMTRRSTRGKELQICQRHAMVRKLRLLTTPSLSSEDGMGKTWTLQIGNIQLA